MPPNTLPLMQYSSAAQIIGSTPSYSSRKRARGRPPVSAVSHSRGILLSDLRFDTGSCHAVCEKEAGSWLSVGRGARIIGASTARTKDGPMSFRDNMQHLRATRNMTQEQLAMLLGVSRQSVSKWEDCRRVYFCLFSQYP